MSHRRIRQQMRLGTAGLVALAALAFTVGCGSSKTPPPAPTEPAKQTPSSAMVVAMGDFHGRPTLEVMVGEAGPFVFILDTGASISVIDTSLATQLGLPSEGTTEIGSPLGGTVPATKLTLRDARVGAVALGNVSALAIDLASVIGSSDAPVGVLATAAFSGKSLTFDFAAPRLLVADESLGPADGERVHDFCAPSGKPSITVDVAGSRHCVNLDTGANQVLSLPLSAAESLPLAEKPTVRGEARLVGGRFKAYGARLDGQLRVGAIAMPNPDLGFHETAAIGVLGQGFLGGVEMTLDHGSRRVRLRPLASGARPTRRVRRGPTPNQKRYGIGFRGPLTDDLVVAFVEEKSPAARGGLRTGDRITALAGTAVADLDQGARLKALRSSPLAVTIIRDGKEIELTLRLE